MTPKASASVSHPHPPQNSRNQMETRSSGSITCLSVRQRVNETISNTVRGIMLPDAGETVWWAESRPTFSSTSRGAAQTHQRMAPQYRESDVKAVRSCFFAMLSRYSMSYTDRSAQRAKQSVVRGGNSPQGVANYWPKTNPTESPEIPHIQTCSVFNNLWL